jgi:tetratricopeptide (TPR) repeat protein
VTDDRLAEAERLYQEGVEAFRSGAAERSRRLTERSLELARDVGDVSATVNALMGLGRLALREKDLARVHRLTAEARALVEDRGGPPEAVALPLHLDAEATRMAGDYERARPLYERSLELNRELGREHWITVELSNLAWVEVNAGRTDRADELLQEVLARVDPVRDTYGTPFCLVGLARVAGERGEHDRAARLVGAAERMLESAGLVLDPADQPEFEKTADVVRGAVGDAAYATALAEGRQLSTDEAVTLARG